MKIYEGNQNDLFALTSSSMYSSMRGKNTNQGSSKERKPSIEGSIKYDNQSQKCQSDISNGQKSQRSFRFRDFSKQDSEQLTTPFQTWLNNNSSQTQDSFQGEKEIASYQFIRTESQSSSFSPNIRQSRIGSSNVSYRTTGTSIKKVFVDKKAPQIENSLNVYFPSMKEKMNIQDSINKRGSGSEKLLINRQIYDSVNEKASDSEQDKTSAKKLSIHIEKKRFSFNEQMASKSNSPAGKTKSIESTNSLNGGKFKAKQKITNHSILRKGTLHFLDVEIPQAESKNSSIIFSPLSQKNLNFLPLNVNQNPQQNIQKSRYSILKDNDSMNNKSEDQNYIQECNLSQADSLQSSLSSALKKQKAMDKSEDNFSIQNLDNKEQSSSQLLIQGIQQSQFSGQNNIKPFNNKNISKMSNNKSSPQGTKLVKFLKSNPSMSETMVFDKEESDVRESQMIEQNNNQNQANFKQRKIDQSHHNYDIREVEDESSPHKNQNCLPRVRSLGKLSIHKPRYLIKIKQGDKVKKPKNILINRYKLISSVLEENKFYNVPNTIEEDMLELTQKNNSLPRKFGLYQDYLHLKQGSLPQQIGTVNNLLSDGLECESMRKLISEQEQVIEISKTFKRTKNEDSQSSLDSIISVLPESNNHNESEFNSFRKKINLSHLNISNTYYEIISKALSHHDMSNLLTINLSYNNLDGSAVQLICSNLCSGIQSIDLSNNNIGQNGSFGLIPLFDSKKYFRLRKLNLENNFISDFGLNTIIPSIISNMSISILNLSHNKLSDNSCHLLKQMLLKSSYIQELYLHWNKFSSQGGILIAFGLSQNLNIKVLDLSHNGLGSIPNLKCGQKIIESCNVLESAVKHLDISFNQFTLEECQQIQSVLQSNKSLYGIHIEGNQANALIDPQGFLFIPEATDSKFQSRHRADFQFETHRIHSVKSKGQNKLQSFDCLTFDNCWICHQWSEVKFQMQSGSSQFFYGDPVFLHLDFENYRPIYMDKDPELANTFTLNRMCPPNRKICFFFSDPCQTILYTSIEYESTVFELNDGINLDITEDLEGSNLMESKQDKPPSPFKRERALNRKDTSPPKVQKNKKGSSSPPSRSLFFVKPKQEEKPSLMEEESDENMVSDLSSHSKQSEKKMIRFKYLDGSIIRYEFPEIVNVIKTGTKQIISKEKDYEAIIKSIPRNPETLFKISRLNHWHRGISVFRDYIPDSIILNQKCFEFDWNSSKLPKILSTGKDIDECKKILQSMYPLLKRAYKFLSSTGIINEVFCIYQNSFANFVSKAQITDGISFYVRDVDFNFISASNIALKPKTFRNPDKALVRNEFLEVMGRIAIDKYTRNDKTSSNSQAMRCFFHEENLLNHLLEYDSLQEWRDKRYWNQECDQKIKDYLPFLKNLYNYFADSRKNEKRYQSTTKSLSLQEFKDLIQKFELLDDLLIDKDIPLAFNFAMMTQIDELGSDRHFQMSFVEFLEAIARIAEKKSMVPLGEIFEEYKIEERIQLKLSFKIESMLNYMKKKYDSLFQKEIIIPQQTSQTNIQMPSLTTLNITSSQQRQSQKGPFLQLRQPDDNKINQPHSKELSPKKIKRSSQKVVANALNFLKTLAQSEKPQEVIQLEKEKGKMALKLQINKILKDKRSSILFSQLGSPKSKNSFIQDLENQDKFNF